MWEKKCCKAKQATDDTIPRMRIAIWIPKATDTHSEYVTLIAFQLQLCLCTSVSMLAFIHTLSVPLSSSLHLMDGNCEIPSYSVLSSSSLFPVCSAHTISAPLFSNTFNPCQSLSVKTLINQLVQSTCQ